MLELDFDAVNASGDQHAPPRSRGPQSVEESFRWPDAFWSSMASHGCGLHLAQVLAGGIGLSTEYSGMGGPEEAMRMILRAGAAHYESLVSPEKVVFLKAGDIKQTCRHMLLHESACPPDGPLCVFGDLVSRAPRGMVAEAQETWERRQRQVTKALREGKDRRDTYASVGRKYLKDLFRIFKCDANATLDSPAAVGHCYRHDAECPIFKRLPASVVDAAGGLHGCAAGVTCIDWSSIGQKHGWLGQSGVVFVAFLREVQLASYDFIVLECTENFKDSEGLSPLLDLWSLVSVCICPSQLGFPIRRPRKYMMLLKKTSLKWTEQTIEKGHEQLFQQLFFRDTIMLGDELARAPDDLVEAERSRMVNVRALPLTRSTGRPWNFYHLLTPAQRRRIKRYESQHPRGSRKVFNTNQTPMMFKAIVHVPVLLRVSSIWTSAKRRPFLALEHVEAQGYQVFGDPSVNMAGAPALKSLSAAAVKCLAGNGMHSACIGACIMFVLGCSERVHSA